jgi:hypothetical protein
MSIRFLFVLVVLLLSKIIEIKKYKLLKIKKYKLLKIKIIHPIRNKKNVNCNKWTLYILYLSSVRSALYFLIGAVLVISIGVSQRSNSRGWSLQALMNNNYIRREYCRVDTKWFIFSMHLDRLKFTLRI